MAYNPANDRVYVTTKYQGGMVNVYNAVSPGYERTLTDVDDPGQIAINPVTNRIWVCFKCFRARCDALDRTPRDLFSAVFDRFT